MVGIRCVIEFLTCFKLQLSHCLILSNCCKECVDKCVRVSLSALACKSTVFQTSKGEHLPYSRVTPVIWLALRPNAYIEVVMAAFEHRGHRPLTIPVKTNHILSKFLKGLFKGSLVVFGFTLTKADEPSFISDIKKDASFVDSIKSGHISHTI